MSGASGPRTSPSAEGGERGQQDARELDRANRRHAQTLERRVAAVSWKADRGSDEHAREAGDQDDVPPGRLAPVEGVGNLLPDELDDVVDRRLEERGGEGDGDTEERCEDRVSAGTPPRADPRAELTAVGSGLTGNSRLERMASACVAWC